MYTFLLQVRDTVLTERWHYFAVFFIFVWIFWAIKAIVARRYRPVVEDYDAGAAVVVPIVDEEPELFRRVLRSILANQPDELVVVINGPVNRRIEQVCEDESVQWIFTERPGKRYSTIIGVNNTTSDLVVLVDSDTIWEADTLKELIKPFADPSVGGVTTHQRIYDASRHVLTRFADWMEDIRTTFSMPALSTRGSVGCLPGRTIAFRRTIIQSNTTRFLHEQFLGVHLEVSDDRTLTNYALKDGYQTVYQRTARVWTDSPTTWVRYIRQQYRWAKGSQYNTMRMLPFMVRNTPFLAFVFVCDVIIPFFWIGTLVNLVWKLHVVEPESYMLGPIWLQAMLVLFGVMASVAIRNLPHLRRQPEDWLFLPVFVVLQTFLLTPIRVWGFFRMAHDSGWGTRAHSYASRRQFKIQGVIPYIVGTMLLGAFAAAGPIMETPEYLWASLTTNVAVIMATSVMMGALFGCYVIIQRVAALETNYSV